MAAKKTNKKALTMVKEYIECSECQSKKAVRYRCSNCSSLYCEKCSKDLYYTCDCQGQNIRKIKP